MILGAPIDISGGRITGNGEYLGEITSETGTVKISRNAFIKDINRTNDECIRQVVEDEEGQSEEMNASEFA